MDKVNLVPLANVSLKSKTELLKGLGYDTDGIYVLKNKKRYPDPYTNKPVKVSNMAILPGSAIVIDDNSFRLIEYLEDKGDIVSADSIITQAAEWGVKGGLNWTKEQLSQYIKDIKGGKVGFANEISQTIQSVKIQRSSPEWKLYSPYVKNPALRKLTNFGLQLRLNSKDKERLSFLRAKIQKKYDLTGLHIAEFVASKILSKFIISIIDVNKSQDQMTFEIEQMLNNIERDVTFIHSDTDSKSTIEKVITKLNAFSPPLQILASKGTVTGKCKTMVGSISTIIKGYKVEEYSDDDEYVVFFKKILDSKPNFP
jgi:hypothetical protein